MSNSTLSDDCAGEILDSGFLVQWEGINPGTGETRKPVWVSRDECPAEMVARWEARIKLKSGKPMYYHVLLQLSRGNRRYAANEQTFRLAINSVGIAGGCEKQEWETAKEAKASRQS